jgi:signal transduction histidine kinase
MPRYTRSISAKLTLMNILVSLFALLLACAGFFIYDQISFRQHLIHTLSAQAQIIGSNSVSAILFDDPTAAANTLSALANSPNVASAGILTADRKLFAQYDREAGDEVLNIPAVPEGDIEGHWFKTTHVVLVRKILSEGRLIGFVYIRSDLREIERRLWRYALISAAVLLVSLFLALVISSVFRRSVAQPIVQLAEAARTVSRKRDYSLRFPPTGERDELGVLIDSFNEMLQEIQERDNSLQAAHDELEHRVAERTRELLSANRELEAFSYSVSHDLRGPLDALNGFSYVLLQQYGEQLQPAGREVVDHIRSAGKRMTELIEDLLNLSRVTTSTMHWENVDLSAIVTAIAGELQQRDPARKVEFVIPALAETEGDFRLLRIVLENLLQNAWKYTSGHETARIEFGAEAQDGRTVYFVRDDGAGFDFRSADRLFQPFQRLHSKAEFPGNGIGLVTVQRIIHRHRGQVWAQGEVEKGATFFFTLGAAPEA